MGYKYSEGYDNVLNVGYDLDFIIQLFTVNSTDLDKARTQLLAIYNLEHMENVQKSTTPIEKSIAKILNRRNINLIESEYLAFKAQDISKSAVLSEDGIIRISLEDGLKYAEMDQDIAEYRVNIERDTIGLLTVSCNAPEGIIFGKERNISDYLEQLERKTNEESNSLQIAIANLEMKTWIYGHEYDHYKSETENKGPKL